jgi:hypothetical protein
MIVKYYGTEGKTNTVPGDIGGVFLGVELDFHHL